MLIGLKYRWGDSKQVNGFIRNNITESQACWFYLLLLRCELKIQLSSNLKKCYEKTYKEKSNQSLIELYP